MNNTRILLAGLICISLVCFHFCAPTVPRNEFQQLEWLAGKWQSTNEAGFYESWMLSNDTLMTGMGFSMANGDTLISEQLDIFASDKGIFYKSLVFGQNEDLPILFKLIHSENDSLVFSNPNHDFPKYIVYRKYTNHSMSIYVRNGFDYGSKGFKLIMEKIVE